MKRETIDSFITFLCSCLVMSVAGSLFAFSVFCEDFQAKMGYTSIDINLISGVGNTATYMFFLVAGPIYDHFGARWTQFLGVLTYSFGYFFMWLTFNRYIDGNVIHMAFYYFLAGSGSATTYLVALAVNMVNFKNVKARGITLGILLMFFGLSSTFYAQIHRVAYSKNHQSDTSGYLFFLFISVTIVNLIAIYFVRPIHSTYGCKSTNTKPTTSSLSRNNDMSTLDIEKPFECVDITCLKPVKSLNDVHKHSNFRLRSEELSPQNQFKDTINPINNSNTIDTNLDKSNQNDKFNWNFNRNSSMHFKLDKQSSSIITINPLNEHIKSQENIDICALHKITVTIIMKSPTFWALASAFVWQQGLTYISNVALIVRSIFPTKTGPFFAHENSLHVTLVSVSLSIGGLVFGYLSQDKGKFWFTDLNVLFLLIQIVLLIPPLILGIVPLPSKYLLYVCSICNGLGWGGSGGLFPGLTSFYFGIDNFGTAAGLLMACVPIGIIGSNHIFGMYYYLEGVKDNNMNAAGAIMEQEKESLIATEVFDLICGGTQCYRTAMLISIGIQSVPVLACSWLVWNHFHRGVKNST